MVEGTRIIQVTKSKKDASKAILRNRYYEGAKLSEYQFRLILQGYAENLTPRKLAIKTRTSEKTIRTLYAKFRMALAKAIFTRPESFGCAGLCLFEDERLSKRGKKLLKTIIQSELFQRHLKLHAPRIPNKYARKDLALDCTLRLFCHISVPKIEECATYREEDYPNVSQFYKSNRLEEHLINLETLIPAMLQSQKNIPPELMPRIHRYPGHVLYEDLRQYLLKHPLNSASNQNIFLMRKHL
ncbi:MAG: hypothetical protein ACRBBN_12660 [Methyloligellaceae bacterium]